MAVRLSNLPLPKDCGAALLSSFQPNVLDCVLRLPDESQETCLLEMIMDNCPLEGLSNSEKGCTRHLMFEYSVHDFGSEDSSENSGGDTEENWAKGVVTKLLNDWCSVCKLYQHAVELDAYLKGKLLQLFSLLLYLICTKTDNQRQNNLGPSSAVGDKG